MVRSWSSAPKSHIPAANAESSLHHGIQGEIFRDRTDLHMQGHFYTMSFRLDRHRADPKAKHVTTYSDRAVRLTHTLSATNVSG
nr:hypothetical protein CFP56_74920 [Quercus suber]